MQMIDVHLPTTDGRELVLTRYTEPEPELTLLLKKLKLELPAHVPDNKPVAGAVLFDTKSDMGPAGMAEMPGKVSVLPSDKPGLYRFQIETGMAGKWALNIGAKVQGN